MRLSIITFTGNGMHLSERIAAQAADGMPEMEVSLFTRWSGETSENVQYTKKRPEVWAGEQMREKHALLFIGACGIAVRAVAPNLADKLHDSPVLVMDEMGHFVIPILSGHVGGANALAEYLAKLTGAVPVITTATDLNQMFAADLFAKRNGLEILNKEGIAKVSSRVLAKKTITITIENGQEPEREVLPVGLRSIPYPPEEPVDIAVTSEPEKLKVPALLTLKPREYIVGMGCRKEKEEGKLEAFLKKYLREAGIRPEEVFLLTSIDKKKEEPGLLFLSRRYRIPFQTYSAEQLQTVGAEVRGSDFVEKTVGVDNVCERAALFGCGAKGTLVLRKQAEDGMTIAIARREWSVSFDETGKG